MMDHVKDLVTFLAKRLVDKPEAVEVDCFEEDREFVIELAVDPDDIGYVVGREGRTARALRTLAVAAARDVPKRVVLDIVE